MDLKEFLYFVATFAWIGVVVGGMLAVDLGYTEPWLSVAEVPGGKTGAFAAGAAVLVVGLYVISSANESRKRDEWKAAGQEAGFAPTDGESGDETELTSTVDGRRTTLRYDRRHMGGGEGGGSYVTFTFGDASLDGPAEDGVLVGSADGKLSSIVADSTGRLSPSVGTIRYDEMIEAAAAMRGFATAETDDLVFVGTSPTVVEAVASGTSGAALRAVEDLEIGAVGDAAGVVEQWAQRRNQGLEDSIAGYPVDNLVEFVPGDAETVTVETRASMRDPDEIRQFAEGVVACADAFETAAETGRSADGQ